MKLQLFSQRAKAWAAHVLGWGPKLGTIGQFGCKNTVLSMIAWACGFRKNPAELDELFTAKKVFSRDPTGTYDFLPDDALDRAFPGRFRSQTYASFRADIVNAVLPTPDKFAFCEVEWNGGANTHFFLMYGKGPDFTIADPWTGAVGKLAYYLKFAKVVKTIVVQYIPAPKPIVPAPLATFAVAYKGTTMASGLSYDAAFARATAAAASLRGALYEVLDAKGQTVATAFVPLPPAAITPPPERIPTPPVDLDYSWQGLLIFLLNFLLKVSGRR